MVVKLLALVLLGIGTFVVFGFLSASIPGLGVEAFKLGQYVITRMHCLMVACFGVLFYVWNKVKG